MPDKPFHHGNLRAELLERAETTLRERGVDQLSLRRLASEIGVSHGAPRSHFKDRSALLQALAERGFGRLTAAVMRAVNSAPDPRSGLRAAFGAHLTFFMQEAALSNLMVTAKVELPTQAINEAAMNLLDVQARAVAAALGPAAPAREELQRRTLLASAVVQGIGGMAASGRISKALAETLLDDATDMFLAWSGQV